MKWEEYIASTEEMRNVNRTSRKHDLLAYLDADGGIMLNGS
jgi:hypothetical protein